MAAIFSGHFSLIKFQVFLVKKSFVNLFVTNKILT